MDAMNRTSSRELLVALRRGAGPLHAQIEAQLRDGVRSGRLAAGERLPSSRALAAELGVSRGVVVEAYGPRAAWAAAQRRALREVADADLGYPPSGGHPRLREALAAYLGRVRGVQAAPERIVVCGGVAEAVGHVAPGAGGGEGAGATGGGPRG